MQLRQKMMRFRYAIFSMLFMSVLLAGSGTALAARCTGGSFFGFPTWYKYLNCTTVKTSDGSTPANLQTPQLSSINDVWLIAAAVLEMLLRLAALAAVAFVIWGGIQYIMSQGEPDKTTKARGTILNAIIGLVIAVISAGVVSYIAGRFH
jgi:ABC-type Fe3+ transport system permease subunit